jgi:uncharacterized delta-60 repeat protein
MRRGSVTLFPRLHLEHLESRETPAAGLLDPTFGTGGLVIGSPPGWIGASVVMQPDGKILAAAGTSLNTTTGFGPPAVFRFNANGTPDKMFGINGKAVVPFTPHGPTMGDIDSLVLQSTGKIVVEVHSQVLDSNFTQALVRLTSTGQIDTTFGTSGKAPEQAGGRSFYIDQVFTQPGGKLAAVVFVPPHGQQPVQFGVMHYTTNGKPDTTFGTGGLVMLPAASPDVADGTIQANGKTVLVALGGSVHANTVLVSRFNANGTLDRTFHGTGSVSITRAGLFSNPDEVAGVTIQADGKILVTDGSSGFTVLRLNADGSLDKGFGSAGVATVQAGTLSTAPGSAAVVQADGKILLPGTDNGMFTLVRLTAAGLPDPTFGADGVVVTSFANQKALGAWAASLTLQSDGKVVVVGGWGNVQGSQLALARYLTTPVSAANASHTTLTVGPASAGSAVTLTATVTGTHGKPTGSVTFLDGTTILGAAAVGSNGQAAITTTALSGGPHHVTAQYSGDATYQASSTVKDVAVKPATAAVTLTVNPVHAGQPVTMMAVVTPPWLTVSLPMTGTVTFYDGTRVLGTRTVSTPSPLTSPMFPGFATLTISNLGPGKHTLTARYTGDANFTAAPSAPVTVTVP